MTVFRLFASYAFLTNILFFSQLVQGTDLTQCLPKETETREITKHLTVREMFQYSGVDNRHRGLLLDMVCIQLKKRLNIWKSQNIEYDSAIEYFENPTNKTFNEQKKWLISTEKIVGDNLEDRFNGTYLNFAASILQFPNNFFEDLNWEKLKLGLLPKTLLTLTNTASLNASCNHIRDFPDWLGELPSITTVDLSNNHIVMLPEYFSAFKSLKKLRIGNNPFNKLPDNINALINLNSLSIWKTNCSTLPDSIRFLKSLTFLDIAECAFKVFPESVCNIKSLKHLNISKNQLEGLPDSLSKLVNLEYFDFSSNFIENINIKLLGLPIKKFVFVNNPFSPKTLQSIVNERRQQYPYDFYPQIIKCPAEAKKFSPHVTFFNIDKPFDRLRLPNYVQNIEFLKNITNINISNAKLNDIGWVIYLSKIEYLNVSHNNIQALPDIYNTSQIEYLNYVDISHNRIKYMPYSFLRLKRLENLNVHNAGFKVNENFIRDKTAIKYLVKTDGSVIEYSGKIAFEHNRLYDWIKRAYK